MNLCDTCACAEVCRYKEDIHSHFPSKFGISITRCPHHVPTGSVIRSIPPVERPLYRPDLKLLIKDQEPTDSEIPCESRNCVQCDEETTETCDHCAAPLCDNCSTEVMTTHQLLCPKCWDDEPGARL